ncbi:Imm72 family immunity protein [Paraburkholderia sp. 22098]|uniref:Imm72 family immunity protein n=1 Tax=Paraburkholderia sp. 22098 TaxID=3453874 RepID=UPI003F854764
MSYLMTQYDMQDDSTRRQVFWLLKRLSSYSLWARKRDAWETFTNAYEKALRTWPKSDPEQMSADLLPTIYEMLSLYNKGLDELAKGRRFVWREGQPFRSAITNYYTVTSYFFTDPRYWERGQQDAPYPPKVEALNRLMRASEYHGEQSPLEVPYLPHLSAHWTSPGGLLNPDAYKYEFYELPYPVFPSNLPEVPLGAEQIVRSGQEVPVDGIWEPVAISREKVLGVIAFGAKREKNEGCFNYLVAGTRAPTITGEVHAATGKVDNVSTHWRLLWEDTRYKDGVIPDESEYFIERAPMDAPTDHGQPADEIEVRTGDVCPVTGIWEAKDFENHRIEVSEGKVMPDVLASVPGSGERRVHWVTWRLVRRA